MQHKSLENSPLTSNDQAKLLIFSLLLVPSIVFFAGIIPTIFLVFGIFMMKKSQDFTHIEVASKNFKIFTYFLTIGGFIWSIGYLMVYGADHGTWLAPIAFMSCPAYAYSLAADHLFYKPLKSRYLWIEKNGIFSNSRTLSKQTQTPVTPQIIKGETVKQYSVADELLKWAKLKEDGHISEQEFNEARAKLLKGEFL